MKKHSFKPGDIIELGSHRLACGDARDAALVSRLVESDRIQLILTDPPYGCSYVEGKSSLSGTTRHRAILNDHDQSEEEYRAFSKAWLAACASSLAKKNALYCFNSDKMLFPLHDGMRDAGFRFGQLLIWAKTHAVVGRLDYLPMHELIAYGWKGTHAFAKAKDKSILVCPKPSKSFLHPTMKPVSLLRRLVLNSTRIGDIVYDPFAGSGSTLIACEHTRRRCLSIEMDPRYCAVIAERFQKIIGTDSRIVSPSCHVR